MDERRRLTIRLAQLHKRHPGWRLRPNGCGGWTVTRNDKPLITVASLRDAIEVAADLAAAEARYQLPAAEVETRQTLYQLWTLAYGEPGSTRWAN